MCKIVPDREDAATRRSAADVFENVYIYTRGKTVFNFFPTSFLEEARTTDCGAGRTTQLSQTLRLL